MKQTLISILFIAAFVSPCAAQWHNAYKNVPILAFGVNDTSLFISENLESSQAPRVWRLVSLNPNVVWVIADSGIDFSQGNVTSFASLGSYFFAGVQNGLVYKSNTNGSSWNVNDSIGSPVCTNGSDLFGDDPKGIGRSEDSGKIWENIAKISATTFAANGICIFANTGNTIERSKDTGNIWSQLSPPFVGSMTTMGSLLFITGTANGSVIESTDSGTLWDTVHVDSGSVQEHVNVLANDGKNLFAGTTAGVYLSKDTGKTWIVEDSGLGGYLNVDAIGVLDTLLFVNSSQRGGWYTAMRSIREMTDTAPASVVQSLPLNDSIEVYPNPATGNVTIVARNTAILGVSVLDVLGLDVLDVANTYQRELTFDVSKLPSGTFFVRIATLDSTSLHKITIER